MRQPRSESQQTKTEVSCWVIGLKGREGKKKGGKGGEREREKEGGKKTDRRADKTNVSYSSLCLFLLKFNSTLC